MVIPRSSACPTRVTVWTRPKVQCPAMRCPIPAPPCRTPFPAPFVAPIRFPLPCPLYRVSYCRCTLRPLGDGHASPANSHRSGKDTACGHSNSTPMDFDPWGIFSGLGGRNQKRYTVNERRVRIATPFDTYDRARKSSFVMVHSWCCTKEPSWSAVRHHKRCQTRAQNTFTRMGNAPCNVQ